MSPAKLNRLLPVGLIMLAVGLMLHNWIRNGRTDFVAGLLIGMSLVFMIAGFLKRPGAAIKS